MNGALERGFGAAIVIPAIASTLKQAQREAADDLHTLAAYHVRVAGREGDLSSRLTPQERRAAVRLGRVLIEQSFNGTVLFLTVKASVMLGGALGGILAQLAITGNTIVTPEQTQKFNPAKIVFGRLGVDPDLVSGLPDTAIERFALESGRFAQACGYGRGSRPVLAPSDRITLRFS